MGLFPTTHAGHYAAVSQAMSARRVRPRDATQRATPRRDGPDGFCDRRRRRSRDDASHARLRPTSGQHFHFFQARPSSGISYCLISFSLAATLTPTPKRTPPRAPRRQPRAREADDTREPARWARFRCGLSLARAAVAASGRTVTAYIAYCSAAVSLVPRRRWYRFTARPQKRPHMMISASRWPSRLIPA